MGQEIDANEEAEVNDSPDLMESSSSSMVPDSIPKDKSIDETHKKSDASIKNEVQEKENEKDDDPELNINSRR